MFHSRYQPTFNPTNLTRDLITFTMLILNFKRSVFWVILFICFNFGNAFSMEWNSKEWLESSCQKDLVGLWVPESHSILAFNELKIESKKISFLKNNGEKVQLEHFGISNQKGWKYIKLKPQKSESETKYPPYLKLRPHLVMKQELSHTNETQLGCQIKIFRYKSKADMKRDKYTNWDIYRKVSNP